MIFPFQKQASALFALRRHATPRADERAVGRAEKPASGSSPRMRPPRPGSRVVLRALHLRPGVAAREKRRAVAAGAGSGVTGGAADARQRRADPGGRGR